MKKLLLLFFFLNTFITFSQDSHMDLYDMTMMGRYEEGITLLDSIITEFDSSSKQLAYYYLYRGAFFFLLNDSLKATADYVESLKVSESETINIRISKIFESESHREASNLLTYYKAFTAYKLQKYRIAIAEIDRLYASTSATGFQGYEINYTKSCYYRGNSKFILKDFIGAIKDYDLVIARDSTADVFNNKKIKFKESYLVSQISSFSPSAYYKRALAKENAEISCMNDYIKACELGLVKACDRYLLIASENPNKLILDINENNMTIFSSANFLKKGNQVVFKIKSVKYRGVISEVVSSGFIYSVINSEPLYDDNTSKTNYNQKINIKSNKIVGYK